MKVKNIECQIAINQITRLLYGEGISEEVERDLKKHLEKCPECVQALERRKALLQAMLKHDETIEKRPAQFVKTPNVNLISSNETISDAASSEVIQSSKEVPTPKRAVIAWKPIAYCATLAIVMFGMSYVMRDPTRLFGDRAANEELGGSTTQTQVLSSGPEIKDANADNPPSPEAPAKNVTPSTSVPKTIDSSTPTTPAKTKETAAITETSVAAPAKTIQPAKIAIKTPVVKTNTPPAKPINSPFTPPKPKKGTLRVYAPDGTIIVH